MKSKYVTYQVADGNLLEHPAVLAWSKLQARSVRPEAVIVLKERRNHPWGGKAAVYRLEGVGPNGAAVIAKRFREGTGDLERTIYEDILPRLSVLAPAYYGSVEATEGEFRWLFIEDAQGAPYSPAFQEHRAAAARWLALLHTLGERVPQANRLPDRGPRYYMALLQSSHECLLQSIANPALKPGDVLVLKAVLRDLEFLGLRWRQLERFCETIPSTLVHCDLADKNIHTRTTAASTTIIPFDWEFSGWGPPAADVAATARPDLEVYWHAVRETWPGLEYAALQQLNRVGTLFRSVAWIDWVAGDLQSEWVERPMCTMEMYQVQLHRNIQLCQWHD
jgi:Phosphotransferase enzyme family